MSQTNAVNVSIESLIELIPDEVILMYGIFTVLTLISNVAASHPYPVLAANYE